MNLLAIDTSTDIASVGLFVNGEMLCKEQGMARSHAQHLLPMIESLLLETGSSLSQLTGIVFGRGPGSFTGLRVALSIAKGLAYAKDLPLYPVSSLAAIAEGVWQIAPQKPVLAAMDARMQQLYWALHSGLGEAHEQVTAASDINLPIDTPFILAGVGIAPYIELLPHHLNQRIEQHIPLYPTAQNMISMVLAGKSKPVSAEEALPVYVRNQVTQGDCNG
ncbi:MAG: tRNA (adenosine(37)-N6)-threonylcarbamoyltransferase complex dimerization subunit type 1 TsaB [Tatlockia sp.]|jgi:tRNA threonylcarbamoyladenosine biosynthesis protein TsaB